jgi:hypothetical protein
MTEAAHRASRTRPREERPRPSLESEERPAVAPRDVAGEEAERRLGRAVAMGVPVGTLLVAVLVGAFVSIGPAILVLAAGTFFGTVAFFWASLRTLGGQAPLAEGFEHVGRRRVESPTGPAERKRTALRALKDIEFEHEIGKLDDADYAELSTRYRDEAKAVMREIDDSVLPQRARAEEIARAYLEKRGFSVQQTPKHVPQEAPQGEGGGQRRDMSPAEGPARPEPGGRIACPSCDASNERDAAFCKGCGARLSPVECPSCSTANEPDAAFCKRCGKPVRASGGGMSDAGG